MLVPLVRVWYCGVECFQKCFSLGNVSKYSFSDYFFSFLILAHQNNWKILKKYINLMFFQGKHTFQMHQNAAGNAKLNMHLV